MSSRTITAISRAYSPVRSIFFIAAAIKAALAADIGRRDHRYAPALALEHVRLGAQEILCESIERGVAVRLIDGDGLCARHVDAVCDFNKLFRGVLRMIKYIVAAYIRKVGRVQRDTDIVRLSEYFPIIPNSCAVKPRKESKNTVLFLKYPLSASLSLRRVSIRLSSSQPSETNES